MEPSASVIVVSNADGKKYKMMLKGDMALLTVGKVKRYLHTATGVDPALQILRFNGQALADGMTGSEVGLYDGAVMFLDVLAAPQGGYGAAVAASTPYRYGGGGGGNGGGSGFVHSSPYAAAGPPSTPVYATPLDIERIRAEERHKLETERRLRELQEQEMQRAAERLRAEERERAAREQEEQQRARDHERVLAKERQLDNERRELEARLRAMEEAKQRDIEELRQQQRQLSVERQRIELERTAPSPLEDVVRQQQAEIERLRNERNVLHRRVPEDVVDASLAALARELQIPPLQLDANQTCAVTLDDGRFNVLLTYDPATQRLYMYATILNSLPADPALKLQLYEMLLEGALLGRDMCGGGVGVSTKNNVVLMSASLDMQFTEPDALAAMARPFLDGLRKWNAAVETLLTGDNPHHRRVPTMQPATIGGAPGPSGSAYSALNAHSAPLGAAVGGGAGGSSMRGASPPGFEAGHYGGAAASGATGGYASRHAAAQNFYGASSAQRY